MLMPHENSARYKRGFKIFLCSAAHDDGLGRSRSLAGLVQPFTLYTRGGDRRAGTMATLLLILFRSK